MAEVVASCFRKKKKKKKLIPYLLDQMPLWYSSLLIAELKMALLKSFQMIMCYFFIILVVFFE